MTNENLMTYCGSHCGTCARSTGFTAFREAASLLAELTDAHGFHHWMPEAVKDFDYAEFRKGLTFFADPESWLVCRNGCRAGKGGPPSCVRECCREHGVDVCFDCPDFPCEKARAFDGIEDRTREYKQLGRKEWLRRLEEKASHGFEAHTGKYYQVKVKQD